ncbi:MAG: hypothetical protein L0H93_18840 [Nocardioides sp.]|nr:hypothetical protein [Nocardioides sp.]
MASNTSQGCMGIVMRVLGVLVAIGVALAILRYLGQGVGIASPQWVDNAFDSLVGIGDWIGDRFEALLGDGGGNDKAPARPKKGNP